MMPARRIAAIIVLTLCSTSLFASGNELAPQRLDQPLYPIGETAHVSNGRTQLWLWTVDTWRAGMHVFAAVTDSTGKPSFTAKTVMPYIDRSHFGAAPSASGYLVARESGDRYQVRTLAEDGAAGVSAAADTVPGDLTFASSPERPPALATAMAALQDAPRVASDGTSFLAVFRERGGTAQTIVARRLGADGKPAGSPFDVADAAETLGDVAVAYGGGQYLVVWQSGLKLYGARVSQTGQLLDRTPLTLQLTNGYGRIAVASDGHEFLVVWPQNGVLRAFVVGSDGRAAGAQPLTATPPQTLAASPAVAFDGIHYVVAYEAWDAGSGTCTQCAIRPSVHALRVTPAGAPFDSTTMVAQATTLSSLGVASSGKDILVTYVDNSTVYGAKLYDENALRPEVPSTLFAWTDAVSAIPAWNGAAYVVGLRYTTSFYDGVGTAEWSAATLQVGADGKPSSLMTTRTGPASDLSLEPPAFAIAGSTVALVVSEARSAGDTPRAVSYVATELTPATLPTPPAPQPQPQPTPQPQPQPQPTPNPTPTPTPNPTPTPTPNPTPTPQPNPTPAPQPTRGRAARP